MAYLEKKRSCYLMSNKLLEVKNLKKTFGGLKAVDVEHLSFNKNELTSVIGPNGAGKSTAMKAIFGMLNIHTGSILLDGENITSLSPQARVAKGMAFVPQTSNVFPTMSVEENLEMGAFLRRDDISKTMDEVFDLFPILKNKRSQNVSRLFQYSVRYI